MNRHRIAVAGCGAAAFGLHLPALTASPHWTVNAVLDRVSVRARQAADQFGIPRIAATVQELLEGADMLAVLTGVHHTLIGAALDAGVHVFTEKPVTLDARLTRGLRARAEQAGLLLEVGAMRIHDPALHALLKHNPHPTGGWLIKADDIDETARRRILPEGFTPYTFADDPPQPAPHNLEAAQTTALQVLLWEGYHQLTALLTLIGEGRAASCTIGPDRAVHATITDPTGHPYTLLISRPGPGAFTDAFHLTGEGPDATAHWPAPYTDQPVLLNRDGHEEPMPMEAFPRMWEAIAGAVTTGVPTGSSDLAQQVEDLALDLASLTNRSRHTHA